VARAWSVITRRAWHRWWVAGDDRDFAGEPGVVLEMRLHHVVLFIPSP
jgi:hypothetical protein